LHGLWNVVTQTSLRTVSLGGHDVVLLNAWMILRIVLTEGMDVDHGLSVGRVELVSEAQGQADAQAVWVFRNVWIVLHKKF
jgi:hypothetical protein